MLNKLQNVATQLAAAGQGSHGAIVQQQVAQTTQMVFTKWLEQRDKYMNVLETKMVARYVTAELLARRYGFEGFVFGRAHQRLSVVAATLGASRMCAIL
jgi:hypothetical protein